MKSGISSPSPRPPVAEAQAMMRAPVEMGRRDFLFATAGLALALPQIGFAADSDKSSNRPAVVDTHIHCFAGKDDARFPCHSRGPYCPDAAATPQHLLECMDAAGVDYAVIV